MGEYIPVQGIVSLDEKGTVIYCNTAAVPPCLVIGGSTEEDERTIALVGVVLARSVDAPAPADPFMPSAEVRDLLRLAFLRGESMVHDDFILVSEALETWVRSWPQE